MAQIVGVHGAFHELWGPNEVAGRWLPAIRDGLWHADVELDADDFAVAFSGDLFRHTPDAEPTDDALQSVARNSGLLAVVGQVQGNGHRAHDPEPYLNAAATGLAVAAGLARTAR